MWQVENCTPFAVERGWVRDRDGAEVWLVALKATFDVLPDGQLTVSATQPPVCLAPQYMGLPGSSSLRHDGDLNLTKRTTDVIALAHACAPAGRTVTQMDVALKVGPIDKVLRVFGNRTWGPLGISSPESFARIPIVYERSFGGVDIASSNPERDWDDRNPVGTGFAVARKHLSGRGLPNIEDPRHLIRAWGDRPRPAGFGPIAREWQPRAAWAGTYDEHWMRTRMPLLAEDLDDRYFQCAPMDQQAPAFLLGGEQVTLVGMRPEGTLRFQLPRIHPGFETRFRDGSSVTHPNRRLHTVIFEPDVPRVSLVWHTALPCHDKVYKLSHTIVTIKAPLPHRAADIAQVRRSVA